MFQPSLIEPIEDIIPIIRQKSPSTLILIDGAHAPGHIDLSVEALNVDFYFGNCHKWMYTPKGTAFMWVAPSQRKAFFPEPTVISSTGYRDFLGRYAYTGTRDYTAFAALPAAIRFRSEILGGDDAIYSYCNKLSREAADILTRLWKTTLLVIKYI
jgi:isopenicillin-N epimerase